MSTVFLPLSRYSRRRSIKALWTLLAVTALSAGITGCGGGNLVDFYTPVPQGLQYVTVTATDGTLTRSFTVEIQIQ
jgi:hypothetical protein